MRNIRKGLIVGGLTGAAAGLVLDGLNRGAEAAGCLRERLIRQPPKVASKVHDSLDGSVSENGAKVKAANIHDRLGM